MRRILAVILSVFAFTNARAADWDWDIRWFVAAASTTGSMLLDEPIHDGFMKLDHTAFLDTTMHGAERYGGLVAPALGFVAFPVVWAVGANQSSAVFQRSKKIFAAVGAYTIATTVLKFVGGRHRPYQGPDSTSVTPFSTRYSSFPSGHTGTAFAFSASLAFQFSSYWVKVPLYTLATLTGVSRMYDNKHWFSDTVAGAFLGYFAALYSEAYFGAHEEDKVPTEQARWSITPVLTPGAMGGALFAQFF